VKKEEEKGGRERKKEKETRRAKESASIVWIPAYSNNSDYSQLSFQFLCLPSSNCSLFSVQTFCRATVISSETWLTGNKSHCY
jgi:hypothetical protein